MPLQIRRGTNAQRTAMTQPLAAGELIYVTDTGAIYIGDGATLGGVPTINLSAQDIGDISAGLLTTGFHTGISFTYNQSHHRIDAVVDPDLSNYAGTIRADAFEGSVFPDDSSLGGMPLVDAIHASINLNGTVKGDIVPDANSAYDLGTSGLRFRDLYLSGTSLYLGNAVVSATSTHIDLPAGSTVGGVAIGTGNSTITGEGVVRGSNYDINIVGDDSTMILNSSTKTIRASLLASDSTTIVDYTAKTFKGNVVAADTTVVVDVASRLFKGSVLASDSTTLLNYTTKVLKGSVLATDNSTILLDNATKILQGSVKATDGSTILDNSTKTFKGSVLASDSATLLNYTSKTLKGSVLATDNSTILDNATKILQGSVKATDGSTILDNSTKTFKGSINASDDTTFFDASTKSLTLGSVGISQAGTSLTFGSNATPVNLTIKAEASQGIEIDSVSNGQLDGGGPIVFNGSSGTLASPSRLTALSTEGAIAFNAFNGTTNSLGGIILASLAAGTTLTNGQAFAPTDISLVTSNGTTITAVLTAKSDKSVEVIRINAGDGTAGAPSIGFSTDGGVDTGFYHPGDGIVCISTNGVEKVRVDSGGMRVEGFMKVKNVAGTLPSPPEAGMIVLDGSTFKGYNGTSWVNLN
jgi:hypothetical protein